jgi:hypothetical protein
MVLLDYIFAVDYFSRIIHRSLKLFRIPSDRKVDEINLRIYPIILFEYRLNNQVYHLTKKERFSIHLFLRVENDNVSMCEIITGIFLWDLRYNYNQLERQLDLFYFSAVVGRKKKSRKEIRISVICIFLRPKNPDFYPLQTWK